MKIIQVVHDTHSIHVCVNGRPEKTFTIAQHISKEIALALARAVAFDYAVEAQSDGFEIKLLPTI